MKLKRWIHLGAFLLLAPFAFAQEEGGETDSSLPLTELQEIKVWGGAKETLNQPSAPARISKDALDSFKYTDVNRALKQAPGVYVREEEGLGLRPNIGLRGTNPDRSKKIVIMEDGVLIGPAPYSAPAAYYTPAMNHTESLEVYKGFSALTYGPNSVGGAINYLSRSISDEQRNAVEFTYGSFNTYNLRAETTDSTSWGGYLLNASHRSSDGFKDLDGGGDTGYYQNDVLGKLRYDIPRGDGGHFVELKLGYAQEDSNETYLGLSESDFDDNPYRRYRASKNDEMTWEHFTAQLDHLLQVGEAGVLKSTLYRHDFNRSWYRLDRFRDNTALRSVVLNPNEGNNPIYIGILRGELDSSNLGTNGQLLTLNNHRVFYSQGFQSQLLQDLSLGTTEHRLQVGFRLHQDQIKRDHTYDLYEMTAGQLERTGTARQDETQNSEKATAQMYHFKDDISWEKWILTLAGRYEAVEFDFENRLTGSQTSREDAAFIPGVSLLRKLSPHTSARVSANQATTLAGLDSNGNEKREESWNYEIGWTYYKDDYSPQFDLIYFYNDYSNLTGTCTASTGCGSGQLDQQFNGGKALIQGLEARYAQGFQLQKFWIPIQLNATWIQAQFENRFNSTSPEWGVGQIEVGDPLPYVPEYQYNLIVGLQRGRWSQEVAVIYQGRMYDQSLQTDRREIDPYGILDWRGSYKLSKSTTIFAKADNILGKEYVSSLKPFGYRPGKPQAFALGFTYEF